MINGDILVSIGNTSIKRLDVIKQHSAFTTCKCCGFTYIPMNAHTAKNCPKCFPQDTYINDDDYINNELSINETVSSEEISFSEPKLVA